MLMQYKILLLLEVLAKCGHVGMWVWQWQKMP